MSPDADTTLAVLAVLLQTLPGDSDKGPPALTYDFERGYRLYWGEDHKSYLQGDTLTQLTERGR